VEFWFLFTAQAFLKIICTFGSQTLPEHKIFVYSVFKRSRKRKNFYIRPTNPPENKTNLEAVPKNPLAAGLPPSLHFPPLSAILPAGLMFI